MKVSELKVGSRFKYLNIDMFCTYAAVDPENMALSQLWADYVNKDGEICNFSCCQAGALEALEVELNTVHMDNS